MPKAKLPVSYFHECLRIKEDDKLLKTEGRDELLAHLRRMVNNPDTSDVAFKCQDGTLAHACRWTLVGRSPVFNAMLSNGMSETRLSEIALPDITFNVMQSVVEFVYTGTLESNPIAGREVGFQMIQAAQFFMIPGLESIARNYIRCEAAHACGNPIHGQTSILGMLNLAVEYQETWGEEAMLLELCNCIDDDTLVSPLFLVTFLGMLRSIYFATLSVIVIMPIMSHPCKSIASSERLSCGMLIKHQPKIARTSSSIVSTSSCL